MLFSLWTALHLFSMFFFFQISDQLSFNELHYNDTVTTGK